jgi:diguanylate cyclase (GGDEF)-like protein
MMDLDYFKYINDTWGHPVGDEVLKQCAEKIKAVIRSTDILVRMGGEEFMILLPQTDSSRAYEIADMIRMELEQDRHPVAGKYTASFGVAGKWEGETVNSFYRRIDEALYHAKEEGRNCVILYDQFYKKDIELE